MSAGCVSLAWWPRLVALTVALVLCAGCDVYHPEAFFDAGFDAGAPDPDAGRPDAGAPDAGRPDAGMPDAGPGCVPRRPPDRPAEADTGDRTLQFALRDVVINQDGDVWSNIGYDHDGECTESVMQGTCESRSGLPQLDGPRGVDNNGGRQVFSALVELDPDLEPDARDDQLQGIRTVFVTIAGYNGLDDDPRVQVWIAQSLAARPMGGMIGDPLVWDGTDEFTLSDADFEGGDPTRPVLFDDVAYIANRRLVMQIPDGREMLIPTETNPLILRLTDAFLVATLSADERRLEDAAISGRWAMIDIQSMFTQLGICPGTSERQNLDVLLFRFPDIRSDPGTDGIGAPCDAYSIALGFTGYPARFTEVGPAPTVMDICP